jgi:hypothetical protein
MMIISDAPSVGVTYERLYDSNFAPRVINYAPLEHLLYSRHLRSSLTIAKILLWYRPLNYITFYGHNLIGTTVS